MYKVLIVDDEPLARLGLKETIEWSQYGFEICGDADNAIDAMKIYVEYSPELIITDICMEPTDGLTLIENIRNHNSETEFIVISGYSDFEYAQRAMRYGVSTYILKPIENDDLVTALSCIKKKLDKSHTINKILKEYTAKNNDYSNTDEKHYYNEQPSDSTPVFSQKQTEELTEAIILSKNHIAEDLIESYFESLKMCDDIVLDEVKNSIINSAIYIIQKNIKAPEVMKPIFGRTVHPAKEIWLLNTIEEIYDWFSAFVDGLMNSKYVRGFSNYSPLIQNAITYIMTNYSGECNIETVANKFYVSSGHLMRQFKQETGKTFLEYLTEYRIYVSMYLLKSKKYKIYEICEMVGYTNTKYFGRIFKKLTGKNPKDFSD